MGGVSALSYERIINYSFPDNARILVVADMHARLDRFQKLLAEMLYDPANDYLVLIGDIIEKGPSNFGIIAYVQQLMQSEKVFVLKGNCEAFIEDGIGIQNYAVHRGNSIVTEMADALNLSYDRTAVSEGQLHAKLQKAYPAIYAWMQSLPIALVTPQFVFVHAAVGHGPLPQALENDTFCLNHRSFLEDGHDLEQVVIVGHFPVINYCTKKMGSHAIVMDTANRMIALDGGNQVDPSGQLNGLVIQLLDGVPNYQQYAVDEFPTKEILADFTPEFLQTFYSIFWPHGFEAAKVLEFGNHFSFCEVKGITDAVAFKNELIQIDEDQNYLLDYYHVSYQLPIKKGAKVQVVKDTLSKYSYIKYNGLLGWVPHVILEEEGQESCTYVK